MSYKRISQRLFSVAIYKALPQVKPEVDALLYHSLNNALNLSPAYKNAQRLPGIGNLIEQISKQIVSDVSRNVYGTFISALEDSKGNELTQKLAEQFLQAFKEELQKERTIQEIESLTVALLEEVKVNYVKRTVQEEDYATIESRAYQIYDVTQERKNQRKT